MLEVEGQSEEAGYTGCSWGCRDFKGCLRDWKDYSFMTTEILKLRVMVKMALRFLTFKLLEFLKSLMKVFVYIVFFLTCFITLYYSILSPWELL